MAEAGQSIQLFKAKRKERLFMCILLCKHEMHTKLAVRALLLVVHDNAVCHRQADSHFGQSPYGHRCKCQESWFSY